MLDKFVCTVNSLVKTDTFGSEQDDRRIESQISVVKKDRDKLYVSVLPRNPSNRDVR